jgi:putative transposase
MMPYTMHHGYEDRLTVERRTTLMRAFAAHPHRFEELAPKTTAIPTAAWINPPKRQAITPEIINPCSLSTSRLVLKIIDMFRRQ